jgi:iron complex transport system permease protein
MLSPLHLNVKRHYLLAGAVLLVLFTSIISLGFGAISITPTDILFSLFGQGETQSELIINKLRLPRTLLAVCIGALMASAGAMTQGLFRNPLADPSLIGITAGASAGASIVIVFFYGFDFPVASLSLISLGAFVGGALSVILVYRIATGETGTSVTTMLLAGIAVTFVAGSLSSALEFISDYEILRQISLW